MKNIVRSEVGGYMLRDDRGRQLRGGMLEALDLAQKLQWLTDEILFLEQHLAAMMLNNRALQSKRLRKPSLKCYCCDGFLISI